MHTVTLLLIVFKYFCYDAIEMFSEELSLFDDADKSLMLSITNAPLVKRQYGNMMVVGQSLLVGNYETIIIVTMIAEFVLS